jgi:hypothetical protein
MKKYFGILEQLSSSVGNFLLLVLAANIFEPKIFANFALHWVSVQIALGFSIQWVFLPITSYPGSTNVLLLNAVNKCFKLFLLAIVFVSAYLYYALNNLTLGSFFLCFSLIVSTTLNDLFRYIQIREMKKFGVLVFTIIRWMLILAAIVTTSMMEYTSELPILLGVAIANLIVTVYVVIYLLKSLVGIKAQGTLQERSNTNDVELLVLSGSNNISTIITSYAFARIDPLAFGAIQAFRSLSNFLPIIIQYIETHVSADFVKQGISLSFNKRLVSIIALLTIMLLTIAVLLKSEIVEFIYGEAYVEYAYILLVTLVIAIVQSINRILSIGFRMKNKLYIFYFLSVIVIGCAFALLIGGLATTSVKMLLGILILQPVLQLLTLVFYERKKSN